MAPHDRHLRGPALALTPGDAHLWLARPARCAAAEFVAAYRALLSPDEEARRARLAFEPLRHEFLVTRALARTTLARYGLAPAAALRFRAGAQGRPALDPPQDLDFNLSNSPGLVACAVARRAVGVDVEPFERAETVAALAGAVLSGAERSALGALPPVERARRALAIWTLKEAYLKARGVGLALPLEELEFTVEGSGAVTARFGAALEDRPERWTFRLLEHAGHGVAVAIEGPARLTAIEVVPLAPGEERVVSAEPPA